MADGPGHQSGTAAVSVAELLSRNGGAAAPAHGHARRRRRRRAVLLTSGGLTVATAIAGAVAFVTSGSHDPQVPATASENAADAAGGRTASATDVTRPPDAVTRTPRSEPAATGPTGPDPTVAPVARPDPPRQDEQDAGTTLPGSPGTTEPPASRSPTSPPPTSRPPTSQPPTSQPPTEDRGPLGRMLRPILG